MLFKCLVYVFCNLVKVSFAVSQISVSIVQPGNVNEPHRNEAYRGLFREMTLKLVEF